MRALVPKVPGCCQLFGEIVESDNPFELREDMLDIVTPGGAMVCAGWHPEWDPAGRYLVFLEQGLARTFEANCTTAAEACQTVEALVEQVLTSEGVPGRPENVRPEPLSGEWPCPSELEN